MLRKAAIVHDPIMEALDNVTFESENCYSTVLPEKKSNWRKLQPLATHCNGIRRNAQTR